MVADELSRSAQNTPYDIGSLDEIVPYSDSTTAEHADANRRYDDLVEDGFYRKAAQVSEEHDLGDPDNAGWKALGEDIYNALIGNRANIFSHLWLPVAATFMYVEPNTAPIAVLGCAYYGATGCGTETVMAFRRAEEHIEEYEDLSERYVEHTKESYCYAQGVYLAAKKHSDTVDLDSIEKPSLL